MFQDLSKQFLNMDNNDIRINFKIQVLNSQDIFYYLILNKIIFMLCLYI